jgi:CRP/FNR family cyclic AMP-dependent transcriptional regulator
MLTAKDLNVDAGSNGSAVQVSLDSLFSDARGLGKLKASKSYPRGSVLFAEGQQPHAIYLLSEGRAKISIGSAEGKTLVLRIAQPGDLLGVNAALTDEPYNATVETIERCQIEFISRQDLLKLLERDKKACLNMAQALGQTLSRVIEHSRLLLLSQSATEKLARLLVRWCDELGKRTPQGIQINSGLTHEEMAQMICASRETVTRVLNELKRAHIIGHFNGTILVRNRRALEAAARC